MTRFISSEISTWPETGYHLIGSRCDTCSATVFPMQPICPRCSSDDMTSADLPRTGTLIAWTTQGFLPGPPYLGDETRETFVPFGVGLVQLGEDIRVEGRLTVNDPEQLSFGMPVELTSLPLGTDDDGTVVHTFAFQPA